MKPRLFILLLLAPGLSLAEDRCRDGFEELARATVRSHAFTTVRDLLAYYQHFSGGLMAALRSLGPDDLWLDVGSGDGVALADFVGDLPGRALGVSYAMDEVDSVTAARAAHPDRLSFLTGRFVEDIPAKELGRPKVITDLFGAASYTTDFVKVLSTYFEILAPGGKVFLYMEPGVRNVFVRGKKRMSPRQFLKSVPGLKVVDSPSPEWNIQVVRGKGEVKWPRVRLVEFTDGKPPTRVYEVIED